MTDTDIADLRRELAEVKAELAALRKWSATTREPETSTVTAATAPATEPDSSVSRRYALRTAGVVAAGALAGGLATVATAGPAAAASGNFDGNPAVTADATTGTAVVATSVSGIGVSSTTASPSNAAVHAVNANGVAVEASGVTAVKGTAPAIAGAIGVSGTCPTGSDNFGGSFQGWTGLIANGTQTTLRLSKSAFGPPASTGNAYVQGDITVDSNGDLWYCINGGPPSVWRQIAATNSAGTYHALTPGRVYDSRNPIPDPGPISTGQVRLLSIADRRDLNTGAVVEANFVPVNATAVFANITVDHTVAEGYLTVNPGGVTAVNASTINWGETGETIANGVILTLDNVRRITVIAGGPGSTDFLIDITGYWL